MESMPIQSYMIAPTSDNPIDFACSSRLSIENKYKTWELWHTTKLNRQPQPIIYCFLQNCMGQFNFAVEINKVHNYFNSMCDRDVNAPCVYVRKAMFSVTLLLYWKHS